MRRGCRKKKSFRRKKFIADLGVSRRVVEWLRSGGHDALHLAELGLHKLEDARIFQKAANEGRVVLTFDLDFGEIIAFSGGRRVGVILFRLNNTTSVFVIARVQAVLSDMSAVEVIETGGIVVVEDSRYRIRRLED